MSVKVLLIYLLQFLSLSVQELVPLEEYDSCGVCPGTIILYECAILGSTTTTVYEITLPDSTNCTLKLVNSRFLGSKDGCLDNLVLARANRIDGNKYISNVSVIVPNITFPTSSSIIIKCLSEEISDPVGTATLEIISSDGFNFPGEVDKNQENGTCAFSVKSSCTVDDYLPSSSCSNCSRNDNVFICDDVQLGKNCSFTVQAALCNKISVESDLAFCSSIGGSDLEEPDTEAVPLAGIIIPVMAIVVIIIICIATCILMIFVRVRHKRKNRNLNISIIPLEDFTDGQLTSSVVPPKDSTSDVVSPPAGITNDQLSAEITKDPPSPAGSVNNPAQTTNCPSSPPAGRSATDRPSSPSAGSVSDQSPLLVRNINNQPSSPAGSTNGQPAGSASDRPFSEETNNGQPSPAGSANVQPSPAGITTDELSPPPTGSANDSPSLSPESINNQPSPLVGSANNPPSALVGSTNDQPSPPAETTNGHETSPAGSTSDQLSLAGITNDQPSPPAESANNPPSPLAGSQPSPFIGSANDQPSLPTANSDGQLSSELESKLREIVNDCMSAHMRKYYELLEKLNEKKAELEREKRAKNLIYSQLQQERRDNAILKKQLKEKDEQIEKLEQRTRALELEMKYVLKQLPSLKKPNLPDVKPDAELEAVLQVSQHQAVKNVQCESGNPSKQDRELNNQEKCTQIITERNNLSPYESDSHRE